MKLVWTADIRVTLGSRDFILSLSYSWRVLWDWDLCSRNLWKLHSLVHRPPFKRRHPPANVRYRIRVLFHAWERDVIDYFRRPKILIDLCILKLLLCLKQLVCVCVSELLQGKCNTYSRVYDSKLSLRMLHIPAWCYVLLPATKLLYSAYVE